MKSPARAATVIGTLLAIASTWTALFAQVPPPPPATPPPPNVVVPPGRPTVFLWPAGAPGSEARREELEEIQGETVRNVHNPSLVVFLPRQDVNTGAGLILAPGGG